MARRRRHEPTTDPDAPAGPGSAKRRPAGSGGPFGGRAFLLGGLAAVLLVTALAWLPSLDFGFVYDDREQILANTRLRLDDYPRKAFVEDLWRFRAPDPDAGVPGGQYYRPVFALWLWGNFQLFGESPRGWHGANLLLHLAVTALVFAFARRLRASASASLAAALLFGLHPIHAENVAWVAGSTDLLLAGWTLGALLLAARPPDGSPNGRWRTIASWALFALAAFTKETAYLFPILFSALRWAETGQDGSPPIPLRERLRAAAAAAVAPGLAAVAVFALRWKVLGGLGKSLAQDPLDGRETLLALPRVLVEYVSMTFFAAPAGLGHPIAPPDRFASPGFLIPLALVASALGTLLVFGRPWRRPEGPLLAAGILLPMLPVLDLRLLIPEALVQDRYLYLPTAFVLPALALAVAAVVARRHLPAAAPAVLVAVLSLVSLVRLAPLRDSFRDEISLFTRATRDAPANPLFHHRLGLALLEAGRVPEATASLSRALDLAPDDWVNAINLSLALGRAGKVEEALAAQQQALDIAARTGEMEGEPRFATLFAQRGGTLERMGRLAEAREAFERATQVDPTLPVAWEGLARVAFAESDWAAGEAAARRLTELAPDSADAWGTLGSVLTGAGRYAAAEEALDRAARLAPDRVEPLVGLAQVYLRTKRPERAREAVERAIRIDPGAPALRDFAARAGIRLPLDDGAPPSPAPPR